MFKYFYDVKGFVLFDWICEIDEYYVIRIELSFFEDVGDDVGCLFGVDCNIIEYGSGFSIKIRFFLD